MLLGLDSGTFGRLLTEMQEPAELVAKFSQRANLRL